MKYEVTFYRGGREICGVYGGGKAVARGVVDEKDKDTAYLHSLFSVYFSKPDFEYDFVEVKEMNHD